MKAAILCVDDEHMILASLRDQLSDHFGDRYLYEFAESAEEAWEIIEEFEEDAVKILITVSDWLMPGTKGDEFLIKLHQRFPKVIKVMLTGQADVSAVERVRNQAELYKYIAKPWQKEKLLQTLEAALDQAH